HAVPKRQGLNIRSNYIIYINNMNSKIKNEPKRSLYIPFSQFNLVVAILSLIKTMKMRREVFVIFLNWKTLIATEALISQTGFLIVSYT
uniref:Uncharacterized protein n=1 Tax=Monodelphis domestica TaxID=13616 RepID=A0A5F8GAF1_MONDO